MAERRMFAKTIIDSDMFLDMSLSTQALYFHLSMRADDDGFVNNPKKIQRMIGCGDDELKMLVAKKFIIPFESGICVIKHWRIHNYIRTDRYKETPYQEEKSQLILKDNNSYTLSNEVTTVGIPSGIPGGVQHEHQCETQVRLGKDRLGKDNNTISKDIVSSTKVQRVIDVWKCFHQLGKKSRSISLTDFKSTLSYSRADHAINRHCDEDDVSKQYIIDNLGREGKLGIIPALERANFALSNYFIPSTYRAGTRILEKANLALSNYFIPSTY